MCRSRPYALRPAGFAASMYHNPQGSLTPPPASDATPSGHRLHLLQPLSLPSAVDCCLRQWAAPSSGIVHHAGKRAVRVFRGPPTPSRRTPTTANFPPSPSSPTLLFSSPHLDAATERPLRVFASSPPPRCKGGTAAAVSSSPPASRLPPHSFSSRQMPPADTLPPALLTPPKFLQHASSQQPPVAAASMRRSCLYALRPAGFAASTYHNPQGSLTPPPASDAAPSGHRLHLLQPLSLPSAVDCYLQQWAAPSSG
ncbi:proline-rich receptor-like protein kinase PERK2 [Zingiber officinale]|uniref:proline-rich receptor-like protein kinase PERK2 n=1 Tax=Zingiber officinale TaxID=94328 RepID=UPI001C4B9E9B|nr:proline-rich receptor-like protein kinase PERK2 [Zingiber officinale]